jgi:hypothetical protein
LRFFFLVAAARVAARGRTIRDVLEGVSRRIVVELVGQPAPSQPEPEAEPESQKEAPELEPSPRP